MNVCMYVCMYVHDYIYIYVTCEIVLYRPATATADPSGTEVITFEQWRTRLHTLLTMPSHSPVVARVAV